MSLGDDAAYGGDKYSSQEPGQTRTRLPDGEGDVYGGARRSRNALSSRNLVTIVGVVVLLIAAIAFANRGPGGSADASGDGSGEGGPAAQPTAPTGEKPVTGKDGTTGIASGFAKSKQGAESAAANYAVALGSDGMFRTADRHAIIKAVYTADAAAKTMRPTDKAYSPAFLDRLGLDANGNPPKGMTFISRTIPVGTKVTKFSASTATVEVWYTGLIGMAGEGSTDPVRTTWKTWTFQLAWADGDWKATADAQKDGPAPVSGDVTVAGADEISEAVDEYGGFTYAR